VPAKLKRRSIRAEDAGIAKIFWAIFVHLSFPNSIHSVSGQNMPVLVKYLPKCFHQFVVDLSLPDNSFPFSAISQKNAILKDLHIQCNRSTKATLGTYNSAFV